MLRETIGGAGSEGGRGWHCEWGMIHSGEVYNDGGAAGRGPSGYSGNSGRSGTSKIKILTHHSVLGPTLFVLFTNDLPSSVTTGSAYGYADDTTVFCIGETADLAIAKLNKASREF